MNILKENLKDRLDEALSEVLSDINESALKNLLKEDTKYNVINWKTDEMLGEEFSSRKEATDAIDLKIAEGFEKSDFIITKVGQDG